MIWRFAVPPLASLLLSGAAGAADLNGVLGWSERVDLSLSVSGVIDQVTAHPGQKVQAGDLLLTLNPTLFKARVAEARAEAERMTEEEAEAKRDVDRAKELYARTVSSTTELDAAQLRHARARTGLEAAQARLEMARRLLAESELRAPFPAVILDSRARPGMAVAAQCQPPVLLSLARADRLSASAPIPAELAAQVSPGMTMQVLADGRSHGGEVTALRYLDEGGYRLEVSLPRSKGLRPGMAATLRLKP